MICFKCGKKIDANASSCPNCGAQIMQNDNIFELDLPNYGQNSEPQEPVFQDGSKYYQDPQDQRAMQLQQLSQNRPIPRYQPDLGRSNHSMRKVSLILGVAASLFCVVSVVLPFFTISIFGASRSVTLLSGVDGAAVLALSILALVFVIAGRNGRGIVNIVMGIMLCGFALIDGVKNKSDLDKTGYGGLVNYGVGFYLLLFCSILIVISGVILIVANKNERGAYGI